MLTCLLVACHRAVRETPTPAKNVSPGLLAFFNDTGHVVTFPEARTFSLQIPGQRDSLRTALRAEHALWRANSVSDYRFLLRTGCFCPGARGWLLIEVRTGQPLRAWDRAGRSAPLSDWDTFTIDGDRKSTRLNSSHVEISYAVFCLKKKKITKIPKTIEIY